MSEVIATPTATTTTETAPQDSGSETIDAKATPAEIKAMKEKFKLTVDGEEIEEELDWNDKETIKKKLQLAAAAKKRMAEASEDKKKAYQIIKEFEADPESMLARLGPKGREIAEKYLLKQIQDDMLSPEEKEFRSTKAELEKYKAEEAKKKEFEAKTAAEKKETELAQNFQQTIIQALEKSGLPKTPEFVKRMAQTMSKNLALGLDLTPEDLAQEVKTDVMKIIKSMVGDSDGDSLINMFGEDVAKKIRKSDIKKLQEKQSEVFNFGKQTERPAPQTQRKDGRPMTIDEWKESINQRIK